VVPGKTIQWRVSVSNNGPSRARDVIVPDRMPDAVGNGVLHADPDARRCPVANGTGGCSALEADVGETEPSAAEVMLGPATRAGRVSVTTTFRAGDGLRWVTVARHWICCPGTTGLVTSALAMLRFACGEGELVG
ncbi:hypothetical protein VM98_33780, partial [Streptomyces rubellomurinus subsp. indigoferus]